MKFQGSDSIKLILIESDPINSPIHIASVCDLND